MNHLCGIHQVVVYQFELNDHYQSLLKDLPYRCQHIFCHLYNMF
nr:MAG TPA: hypothetical protein [Caudoviricetes sp.]